MFRKDMSHISMTLDPIPIWDRQNRIEALPSYVFKCANALFLQRRLEQRHEIRICLLIHVQRNHTGVPNGVDASMGVVHHQCANGQGLRSETKLCKTVE